MQSVGQKLREARLQQKLALEQVSSSTCISLKNLHALESDDLSKITSFFFYKSFVRQFAEQVKLDYELDLADALQEVASKFPEPLMPGQGDAPLPKGKSIRPRKQMSWRWLSSVAALVVMVMACSTLYAMWESSKSTLGEKVETLVRSLANPGKKPASNSAAQADNHSSDTARTTASVPAATATDPAARNSSADSDATSQNGSSTGQDGSSAAQPGANVPDPQTLPQQQADSRPAGTPGENGYKIELDATERSWLSITADGRQVYNGILEPDQSKVLEGRNTARLRTGNAGGINVVFNGKSIGSLGARGQVRTVVFTKDRYEIVETTEPIALTVFTPNAARMQ